jgi:NADH-quinone oxidoreductase subunit J
LFGVIAGTIFPPLVSVNVIHAPTKYGEPATLGHTLFTQFVWPFEVASILLLVGIVGSILLAKRKI